MPASGVRSFAAALGISLVCALAHAQEIWRSELYREDWAPPSSQKFETDKFLQDFSYAGYHSGEKEVPRITAPVFDVTSYGADATGQNDSTVAIQKAIDEAGAHGGGVVFLPSGTFNVSPQGTDNWALRIRHGNTVLRGAGRDKTFLFNSTYMMRLKSIILAQGGDERWRVEPANGPVGAITSDLLSPTREIPVETVDGLKPGDWIILRADATDAFIAEHNMADKWGGKGERLVGVMFQRQIVSIDSDRKILTVDVPTRYYLKMRDRARVYPAPPHIEEVGVEDLSLGNQEHPRTRELDGWGLTDFAKEGLPAHDVHACAAVTFNHLRNSWISNVATYHPPENATNANILSNGVVLNECRGITVTDCDFQYALYGGGGGNAYMYRMQNSNECLVKDCVSGNSRHGFVVAGMASSGNVFLRGTAKNTQVQTAGSGTTAGKGSDHHMYLSQSNLADSVLMDGDFFDAHYRTSGDAFKTPIHGQTGVHSAFWNLKGESYHKGFEYIVHSDQVRTGYIIGTRGKVSGVRTDGVDPERTAPLDHVEGVGKGDTLVPASLYEDQLRRRLKR